MDDILNDTAKFRRVDEDPIKLTIQRDKQLKTFLRSLKKDGVMSESVYQDVFPSGSRIGILYRLPETHKPDVPLRPILSSICTMSYKMEKK